ncbi:hypothetical protein B0H11DRAFT_2231861 [Mycena galericulata]|nr:hypothetical protein B0H11DRAFT_2231861 [Mycena galericulata]
MLSITRRVECASAVLGGSGASHLILRPSITTPWYFTHHRPTLPVAALACTLAVNLSAHSEPNKHFGERFYKDDFSTLAKHWSFEVHVTKEGLVLVPRAAYHAGCAQGLPLEDQFWAADTEQQKPDRIRDTEVDSGLGINNDPYVSYPTPSSEKEDTVSRWRAQRALQQLFRCTPSRHRLLFQTFINSIVSHVRGVLLAARILLTCLHSPALSAAQLVVALVPPYDSRVVVDKYYRNSDFLMPGLAMQVLSQKVPS